MAKISTCLLSLLTLKSCGTIGSGENKACLPEWSAGAQYYPHHRDYAEFVVLRDDRVSINNGIPISLKQLKIIIKENLSDVEELVFLFQTSDCEQAERVYRAINGKQLCSYHICMFSEKFLFKQ
jgi:hypothetical protein